jgi:hypothetical protein
VIGGKRQFQSSDMPRHHSIVIRFATNESIGCAFDVVRCCLLWGKKGHVLASCSQWQIGCFAAADVADK